jgi:hypothetical protein
MLSCKSKAVVAGQLQSLMKAKEYNSEPLHNKNFSTLYIKASVKYSDDRQSQM